MIGTGAAILGASIIGAGASIWGANAASEAQGEASIAAQVTQQRGQDMALAAQREALGFQREVYGNQRENFAGAQRNFTDTTNNLSPFIRSGTSANNLLASFYGLDGANPALGDAALSRFYQSPDFQFALKGGVGALDNSASAKGSLLSGNQLRAVSEYGQGLATQNLGQYLQRISGMSQQGQTAATNLGQLGIQMGQVGANLGTGVASTVGGIGNGMANSALTGSNSVAQSQMAQGTAEASGILGTVRGINAGLNGLSLYNQMGRSSYGGGGALGSYAGVNNPTQIGAFY